jgi:hypothetical protein
MVTEQAYGRLKEMLARKFPVDADRYIASKSGSTRKWTEEPGLGETLDQQLSDSKAKRD